MLTWKLIDLRKHDSLEGREEALKALPQVVKDFAAETDEERAEIFRKLMMVLIDKGMLDDAIDFAQEARLAPHITGEILKTSSEFNPKIRRLLECST